jgi:hypothetical protein
MQGGLRRDDREPVEEESRPVVASGYIVDPAAVAQAMLDRALGVLPAAEIVPIVPAPEREPVPRLDAA